MRAPIEIEIVISPIQTSIVTPAEIRTYASTSKRKKSKKTMPSAPKTMWAQPGPTSAEISSRPPAMSASDVSAKYASPLAAMDGVTTARPSRGTSG
jgi:hypothetical protein